LPAEDRPSAFELAARFLLIALVAVLLGVAIHGQSLTGDGAYHLIAGHQALRHGQNLINLEHPPLVKWVAALPLLAEDDPLMGPLEVEEALAAIPEIHTRPELLRRATVRGRWLVALVFVVPFLAATFFLGRRFGGERAGWLLLAMVSLTFWALANLAFLQTDSAVAAAYALTLLAGMRYLEAPGFGRAALLGLGSGLALAVKFSGLLIGPTVVLAFLLAPGLRAKWRRHIGHLALSGIFAFAVPHASYAIANLDYDGEAGRAAISSYCQGRGTLVVGSELERWEAPLLELERLDPFLAQWAVGFLGVRAQNAVGVYPSFAFGEVFSEGRWWYFPVLFFFKTPLVILAVLAMAFAASLRRRGFGAGKISDGGWLVLLTAGVYLATAITSNYNLGIRHLLPISPLLYLPAAVWLARRPRLSAGVVALLAVEMALLAPLWLSATNTWWLGPHNPTRFAFAWGNLEYRQNFVELARVAERRGLDDLAVLYPQLGEAVVTAYLPGARLVEAGEEPEPGWYAVNVMIEQFVPAILRAEPEDLYDHRGLHALAERWLPTWRAVAAGRDHGYVAGTFHLYEIESTTPVGTAPERPPG